MVRINVKLGSGTVAVELLERRKHSCRVRLFDNNVIIRKNWQTRGMAKIIEEPIKKFEENIHKKKGLFKRCLKSLFMMLRKLWPL